MKIQFIYPAFERHAQSHPELRESVPANEYVGSPSLGIASVAACTPAEHSVAFVDDRIHPVTEATLPEADLYALSFFTPAAERAMAIADLLRQQGKKVVAGGIFPTMMPEVVAPHFDAVIVGEGEGVWAELVADAARGTLEPRYQMSEPLDLATVPPPNVDLYMDAETPEVPMDDYPLQISRGCPAACNACVLPGCMGKEIRFFPEETVRHTVERYSARGKRCNLTEDTSFMPMPKIRRRFRKLLDDLAQMRETMDVKLSYIGTSMPFLLGMDPKIIADIQRAGVFRFYLVGGFDPVTQGAFGPGDPKMLEKAERCVRLCQEYGVEPYVSFLVGNEGDDEGTFDRMLQFSDKVELRIAEFAVATPYPGTPMWHKLVAEDRILHRRWTKYNDANVVFKPKQMSPERLQEGYLYLWREFYKTRQNLAEADYDLRTIQF